MLGSTCGRPSHQQDPSLQGGRSPVYSLQPQCRYRGAFVTLSWVSRGYRWRAPRPSPGVPRGLLAIHNNCVLIGYQSVVGLAFGVGFPKIFGRIRPPVLLDRRGKAPSFVCTTSQLQTTSKAISWRKACSPPDLPSKPSIVLIYS